MSSCNFSTKTKKQYEKLQKARDSVYHIKQVSIEININTKTFRNSKCSHCIIFNINVQGPSKETPLKKKWYNPKSALPFLKIKDERKASSLGLLMRGHLSTCVSSLLKNGWIYVKTGQIESCT